MNIPKSIDIDTDYSEDLTSKLETQNAQIPILVRRIPLSINAFPVKS